VLKQTTNDSIYDQRSPWTLVTGNIRFVRIFVGVPWKGGDKLQCGGGKRQFSLLSKAYILGTVRYKANLIIW